MIILMAVYTKCVEGGEKERSKKRYTEKWKEQKKNRWEKETKKECEERINL